MLLTITTTYQPATDLGYLLHKNPARVQLFSLPFGQAHIFYPEASQERCTAALLVDVDTIRLVRGRDKAVALKHYVNDRAYATSSFLSVAIASVFGSALNGHCTQRPELVTQQLPLQARLIALPCALGEGLLRRLFEPLGYALEVQSYPLDEQHVEWGMSPYYTLTLSATCCLSELLSHLYVLIPVLDNDKHYWIGADEVDKLLRHGKGWLETHPERRQIVWRYLRRRHDLIRDALTRLVPEEEKEAQSDVEEEKEDGTAEDGQVKTMSLHDVRLQTVLAMLQSCGAHSVLDLGCGEGKLLKLLLQDKTFERILGLDISYQALEKARRRLHFGKLSMQQKKRLALVHGALTYRDKRLEGFDAAAVVEVIEHLDQARLAAFERVLFEFAHPATVIITTPNAEYNTNIATLAPGQLRHKDHRFEWTRQEFERWATRVAERYGYNVQISLLARPAAQGAWTSSASPAESIETAEEQSPEVVSSGAPTQMGVFTRKG
ncbi:3' terminal RNA ribose 2'-O-methyltransferase Hen1 [Ktedonosporobacter rubrisoli]|uniref:Small RNA 2'-O-methyltransferase n=1 Tax=Ktedonosporobacter rubrisoli TaxID=2509675 RepID=A0A4P6K6G9_KTERU|nr:3' terminal RNA ribose 2'-O-methyltransferase Hen1 [Ktedonosporobacter rubrisoli]QBD83196.1 3' terminal RNA ribose 2'-O-methyltransferase Hen1 [Ktedonosporobacter rubrisoli]